LTSLAHLTSRISRTDRGQAAVAERDRSADLSGSLSPTRRARWSVIRGGTGAYRSSSSAHRAIS